MPACTRQRFSLFCYKWLLKQYSIPHPVSLPSCIVFPGIRAHFRTWDRRVNCGDGTKADIGYPDLLPSVSALLRYLLKSEVRMWTKDKASLCALVSTPEPVRLLKWPEDTLYPERRARKEARVTPTVSDWKGTQWEDHMFLPHTLMWCCQCCMENTVVVHVQQIGVVFINPAFSVFQMLICSRSISVLVSNAANCH